MAYLDTRLVDSPTVCHKDSELLVMGSDARCAVCSQYRG